jgi:type II secretory pathway pseudopilin PulG
VVAIIGVIASVTIFSLDDSKGKAADKAIQSAMDQALNQAELYYVSNRRSYEGVCEFTTLM